METGTMSESAINNDNEKLLKEYWACIEQQQNYSEIQRFFAPDALLVDPLYGPLEGALNIGEFLQRVTIDMQDQNLTFSLVEYAAQGDVGWSRWSLHLPDGSHKDGVSIYRFLDGLIVVQRDFIGTNEL
jgi:ketosteroid isomerase-like protein